MPTLESPLLPTRIDRAALLRTYLEYTRDHNTGFNPAWEYLGASEMQRLWYQFEYFHSRFLKKAGMEVGVKATQLAISTGMAAAIATPTGPIGVAASAATTAVIGASAHAFMLGVKTSVTKGHRQWDLAKGRAMFTPGDGHRAYYYWPGYETWRMHSDDFDPDIKIEIKNKIYFKPPKSGERINRNAFSYESMLLGADNLEEQKRFNVIWETTKFWPMLDYLFFNQSFYTKFQNFKGTMGTAAPGVPLTADSYKDFLLATRFYFLSRDFYVDHFFNQVLPKYEIILSRYKGVFVGSNLLNDFFGIVHQKIDQGWARASGAAALVDLRLKINTTHTVSLDIIKSCQSLFSNLPTEMQVVFQQFMRSLFLEEAYKAMSSRGLTAGPSDGFVSELRNNEDAYDRITDSAQLEKAKKFILRTLAQSRRDLFNGAFSSKSLLKQTAKLDAAKQGIKTRLAYETYPLQELISKAPTLYKVLNAQETKHTPSATDVKQPSPEDEMEVSGGINVTEMTIDGALGVVDIFIEIMIVTGINEYLKVNKKIPPHIIKHLERVAQVYGAIRVIGGTANFICKGIIGDSLFSMLGDSKAAVIGSSMGDGFLIGSNVVSILTGVALQYGKNLLYTKMDQDCLTIIDKLVVAMSEHILPARSISPPSIVVTSPPAVQSSVAAVQPSAHESIFTHSLFRANESVADAQTYLNTASNFQKSTLGLGGIRPNDGLKLAYSMHRIFTVRAHKVGEPVPPGIALPDVFNEYRSTPPPLFSFRSQKGTLLAAPDVAKSDLALTFFFGSGNLDGRRMIEYAAEAVKVFTSIENQWLANGLVAGLTFPQHVERLRAACSGIDNIQRIAFGLDGAPVPQDSKACVAMAEAWGRATEAGFLLLQLETSIADHLKIVKSKKTEDIYSKAFEVYKRLMGFINTIIIDKASVSELLLETNYTGALHATPMFIRARMIFMRSLYLTGIHHYNKWMHDAFGWNPEPLQPIISQSDVPMIVLYVRDEYIKRLQVSNMSYDAPDFAQNAMHMVHGLSAKLEHHFRPVAAAAAPVPSQPLEWHDFSDLKLGLKFAKDPASFTDTEKQMLYKDFGRVVRHLFNSAATPKELSELKEKLKAQIEALKNPNVVLNKSHIEAFMNVYLQYIQGVCKTENFLYYARIYQFIQETVRIDFLKSTEDLRGAIIASDLDEEIKTLTMQLQLEQDLLTPQEFPLQGGPPFGGARTSAAEVIMNAEKGRPSGVCVNGDGNLTIQSRYCIRCKKYVVVTQILHRKPDGSIAEGVGVCPSGHQQLRGG